MQEFWSGERVSGEARGIPFRNAVMLPKPSPRPRPRLLIGGYVDRVLQRVADEGRRLADLLLQPPGFARRGAKIRELAEEAGRDPGELGNVAQLPLCIDDSFEAADRRARAVHRRLLRSARRGASRPPTARSGERPSSAPNSSPSTSMRGAARLPGPVRVRAEQVERFAAEVLPLARARGSERGMTEPPTSGRRWPTPPRWSRDGDIVVAGGCCYSRTPWAMLLELLRAGADRADARPQPDVLRVRAVPGHRAPPTSWYRAGSGSACGGASPRCSASTWSATPRSTRSGATSRSACGSWPASMGMPFLPTASLLGSDLLKRVPAQEMNCPFTGELLVAVPALVPDVALIHVHTVDALGNAQVDGPAYMDVEIRARRQHGDRHGRGGRPVGGDRPHQRPHADPGFRGRRGRRGPVRLLPARVPRPLRGRLRPLRHLHRDRQGGRRRRACASTSASTSRSPEASRGCSTWSAPRGCSSSAAGRASWWRHDAPSRRPSS